MSKFPKKIKVKSVLKSRYQPGYRPVSWDDRVDGIEKVVTEAGEELDLYSNGGQSSPAPGWELMLTKENPVSESSSAIAWTLYGIAKN